MELQEQIPYIEGFLSITSHRNKVAAWGILQDQMLFFYIITIIVIVGIIYYLHKYLKGKIGLSIAISLILGGAIGNFIDRIFRKEVVDFLDFIIINYNLDRKSTRLNSSHVAISYAVFCLKKKK